MILLDTNLRVAAARTADTNHHSAAWLLETLVSTTQDRPERETGAPSDISRTVTARFQNRAQCPTEPPLDHHGSLRFLVNDPAEWVFTLPSGRRWRAGYGRGSCLHFGSHGRSV